MGVARNDNTTVKAMDETARIHGLLHEKYGEDPWYYITEVPHATGGFGRTIDAIAINVWQSQFQLLAFEIKTSRGDFTREVNDPSKRKPFVDLSSQFYFVVPVGMVQPDEVPAECGLMYAEKTRLKRVKIAQQREVESIPPGFFRSLVRQLGRKYEVAYKGRKCFRLAGQDLTHEEFLKRSQGIIDQQISDSGIRGDIRKEERTRAEDRFRIERTVMGFLRRAELGFPQLWGHATGEEHLAQLQAWAEGIQSGGNPVLLQKVHAIAQSLNKALGIDAQTIGSNGSE